MSNKGEQQYLDMCKHILETGREKLDRTGTGTIGVHGYMLRFNLEDGFPLLTTKKLFTRGIIEELLWFLKGDTNLKYLIERDVKIWDAWPYQKYVKACEAGTMPIMWTNNMVGKKPYTNEQIDRGDNHEPYSLEEYKQKILTDELFAKTWGDCGPIYGKQWVAWNTGKEESVRDGIYPNGEFKWKQEPIVINQIRTLINILKSDPSSRRLIVNAWNPAELSQMCLTPCHCLFQFHTTALTKEERIKIYERLEPEYQNLGYQYDKLTHEDFNKNLIPKYRLDLQLYQRSTDVGLGLPFNIASYALLLQMVAQCVDMVPGEFVWTGGDTHIYKNHIEQIKEQTQRVPFDFPTMKLNPNIKDIFSFKIEDFELKNYNYHPTIKMDVSV